MAESIFNDLTKGKHQAISVGTRVVTEERNKEGHKVSDPNIIAVMQEIGIDVTDNIRNQLKPEILAGVDKVVVMSEQDDIPEYLKGSGEAIFWDIADPFEQSLEFTRKIRDKIKILVSNLITHLD